MAHRLDGDSFDDLAVPGAIDLGLQIHPDADMDRHYFNPVTDGKTGLCAGQVENAVLFRQPRESARRLIAQMSEAEAAVPRHGERLAAGVDRHPIALQADD